MLLANLAALWFASARPYLIDAGTYGDQLLLKGFYGQESNERGATYRWTGERSLLVIEGAALSPQVQLRLNVGGTPAGAPQPLPASLEVNGQPWGTLAVDSQPRQYHLLLPAARGARLSVGLSSPLTSAAADPRAVGLRLDSAELQLHHGWLLPLPGQLAAQMACLLLIGIALLPLQLPRRWLFGVLALGALAMAALQAAALPLMALYLPRLVGACGALALLTWLVLPLARRWLPWLAEADLRWFWVATLLAASLRMFAMLYPPFATHDLPLNMGRLEAVTRGILILIAPSTEFADEMTIYPPAPYIVLAPTYLLTDYLGNGGPLVLYFGIALIDGTSAFLIGLLALRLGAGSWPARIAALLYVGSSLSFTALWWGFTAQTFGQWLTTPLALLLIACAEQPRPRNWLAAFVVFQIALLTHAGVAVLDVVWVTLTFILLMLSGQMRPEWWRGAFAFYVASGVTAFVLLYIDVFFFMLSETREVGQTIFADLGRGIGPLFVKGTLLAYTPVGLVLVPAGLWLLWRRLPPLAPRAVVAAWLITVVIFVAVDLVFGLIVRHLYFMLPLACVAAGLALSTLAERSRWLAPLAWACVLAYGASGLIMWWLATVEYIKPTMAPLTH